MTRGKHEHDTWEACGKHGTMSGPGQSSSTVGPAYWRMILQIRIRHSLRTVLSFIPGAVIRGDRVKDMGLSATC